MNTQEDSALAKALNGENVHPIPEGSKPGLLEPEFRMVMWPNLLERSSEQRLLDYNREYEAVLAFYYAAGDVENGTSETKVKEKAETAVEHAVRMLHEIEDNAYSVPVRTVREAALKARIMSSAKSIFWDRPIEKEHDADLRFLIEDVLALGGLDRIKGRDFSFTDLMPGYVGPERLKPVTEAVAETERPVAQSRSAIHALGVEVQSLYDLCDRIGIRKLREERTAIVLEQDQDAVLERIHAIEQQVSYMKSATLADVMLQVALIHDAVAAAGLRRGPEDRAIDRMTSSILDFLSRMTGLSLNDVGAGAYLGYLSESENRPLSQRYDPDRFARQPAGEDRAA